MTVYLLHFDRPITNGHPCRHYLGYAPDLAERLHKHEHGNGARLTQVALERGISWQLARTWEAHEGPCQVRANGRGHCKPCRDLERRLKAQRNGPRLCPICQNGE